MFVGDLGFGLHEVEGLGFKTPTRLAIHWKMSYFGHSKEFLGF